jgi:hypothetical protein
MRTFAPEGVDEIATVWLVPDRIDAQPVDKPATKNARAVCNAIIFFIVHSFHEPECFPILLAVTQL